MININIFIFKKNRFFCPIIFWVFLSAFTFPNQPADTKRKSEESEIDANLMVKYNRELKAIKSKIKVNSNLKKYKSIVSTEIKNQNFKVIKSLTNETKTVAPKLKTNQVQWITKTQAELILNLLRKNPVVSSKSALKYSTDPTVGFCFGRAAYVHIELLRRQVNPQSIAKVFAIGSLKMGMVRWDFHMATIVRGPGQTWWVIDELMDRIVTIQEWVARVNKLDVDTVSPTIRYYFTDAVKFQPTMGAYTAEGFNKLEFSQYFKDLSVWFDANPVKKEDGSIVVFE